MIRLDLDRQPDTGTSRYADAVRSGLDLMSLDHGDAWVFGVRVPFPLSILLSIVFLPLLLMVGAVSIPVSFVRRNLVSRREQRLFRRMKTAGRCISWHEATERLEVGDSTLLGEYLGGKGPFRIWLTSERITLISPHPCCTEKHPWVDQDYSAFFDWCSARFTDVQTGTALLVEVPEAERHRVVEEEIDKLLTLGRYVAVLSLSKMHS